MTPGIIAEVVGAWFGAVETFAALQPHGWSRDVGPVTRLPVTGVPLSFLNGVFSSARQPDFQALARCLPTMETSNLPWSLQIRGEDASNEVRALAEKYGRHEQMALPFMIREMSAKPTEVEADAGLIIRRATAEDASVYLEALGAGFEMPQELFAPFASPSVLSSARMSTYLAWQDGHAIGTGLGVESSGWIGVFNIATLPKYRRRGIGRAITAAILRDGYRAGARGAFLHASSSGWHLYEAMGFRLAERWTVFLPK